MLSVGWGRACGVVTGVIRWRGAARVKWRGVEREQTTYEALAVVHAIKGFSNKKYVNINLNSVNVNISKASKRVKSHFEDTRVCQMLEHQTATLNAIQH